MATTTKLVGFGGFYGYESYSNSASNHLYIGAANDYTKYNYHSRITFSPLSSIAAIGSSRISVRKIVLYIRRDGGGPTTIRIGCSSSNAWNAQLDAAVETEVPVESGMYAIDVSALARAVESYASNWFIHFTGKTPTLRLDGTGQANRPYLEITWEYAAATIDGTPDIVTLGENAVYTITPEVSGETHTLEYAIGDSSGTIIAGAGNSIAWAPPRELAAEITDDDTGIIEIRMTAYDSGGAEQRTEVYFQTVRVPEDVLPDIQNVGVSVLDGLQGNGLTGRSALSIQPVIDMRGALGATISSVSAVIIDGGTARSVSWPELNETSPGIFTGAAVLTAILINPGYAQVQMTVTDSRGRSVTAAQSVAVYNYALPTISAFSVERYEPAYDDNEEISGYQPSDIGDHVWVNLTAAAASVAPNAIELNSLEWTIDAVSASGETLSASGSGGRTITISRDRTLFPASVSGDESWQYTLTLIDAAGGIAYQYSAVLPGHVGFALGADKWAAAIGMIPNGSKTNPLFEVAKSYQSRMHGGVWGADEYRIDRVNHTELLGITHESFDIYSEELAPRVSRVGPIVFLDGQARNTVDLASGFDEIIATLPEWARPATPVNVLQQGSGATIWWLRLYADGSVRVHRYRSGGSYTSAAAGCQFPLTACWLAADAFE